MTRVFWRQTARPLLLLGLGCLLLAGCRTTPPPHHSPTPGRIAPAATDLRFLEHLASVLDADFVPGNQVTELVNGEQFLPAMLDAIRGAQREVCLESYIFWSDATGRRFINALSERARAGVPTYLIIDWIGSRYIKGRDLKALRAAGVRVHRYHPPSLIRPLRINHRDHRKLLVVDETVAFLGGAGVADLWDGNGDHQHHWRDSFYRVEGPVVASLRGSFWQQWRHCTRQSPPESAANPTPSPTGQMWAQPVADFGPRDEDLVYQLYREAIAAAHHHIRIGMAYFVPDATLVEALLDARRRGVTVEILLPGKHMDSKPVTPASRRRWGKLLKAGARIYLYQPTMYHNKLLIADTAFVSIGSANLDPRTFRSNDELNLNVHSPEFAADQIRRFELDLERSREITYGEWKRRSLCQRVYEILVWPFIPLL